METLIQALKAINDVIWGPGMLILLIGTGLYLTVGLRFYTFRNIFSAFSMLWKGRTSSAGDKGELTPFNALMTALAGTIGTGASSAWPRPPSAAGRAVLDVVYRYGRHGDQIFRNPACRPLP